MRSRAFLVFCAAGGLCAAALGAAGQTASAPAAAGATPAAVSTDRPKVAEALAPLAFLVGDWEGTGSGTPGQSTGSFSFQPEADGRGLLRRAINDSPSGRHEDLTLVYAEPGAGLRALYIDGEGHVIHYAVTRAADEKRVEFLSDKAEGAPRFRLTYTMQPDSTVKVAFAIARPGSDEFRTYTEGVCHRSKPG